MSDRIQINGVWYVREDSTKPTVKLNPKDVVYTVSCEWETENWAFKATRIAREDDITDLYPDPIIDITDKRPDEIEDWIKHDCDNPRWFLGVLNNDPESMPDADDIFDSEGLAEFKAFLGYLIEKGWLKRNTK